MRHITLRPGEEVSISYSFIEGEPKAQSLVDDRVALKRGLDEYMAIMTEAAERYVVFEPEYVVERVLRAADQ